MNMLKSKLYELEEKAKKRAEEANNLISVSSQIRSCFSSIHSSQG